MKNIHVLPTEKPSRFKQNNITKKISLVKNKGIDLTAYTAINIYITSDEENKDPCFIFNNCIKTVEYYDFYDIRDTFTQYPSLIKHCKKIILTTDQDLIKDGVQAIDDEFIEWFIKNPSCESVEVETIIVPFMGIGYKIIIPKEEVKEETLEEVITKQFAKKCMGIINHLFDLAEISVKKRQEINDIADDYLQKKISKILKEQDKKMYSEEDLKESFSMGRTGKTIEDFNRKFIKK